MGSDSALAAYLGRLLPRELFANMSWLLAGQLVEKGAVFVTTILLARNLDVADYAAYNYFVLTTAMLSAYAAMGLGVTSNRYFASISADQGRRLEMAAPLLLISAVMSLVAAIITFFLPEEIILGRFALPLWAVPLGVFFYTFSVVPVNALSGMEKFSPLFHTSVAGAVLLLAFAYAAARTSEMNLALWGVISAAMARSVLTLFLLGRYLGWKVLWRHILPDRKKLAAIFSFSVPMFLVSILSGSAAWLVGRIIAGGAGGEKAFSLFAIGLQWFSLAMFLPGIVSRVTFPRIVRSIEQPSSPHDLRNNLIRALVLSGGPLLILSVIMFFAAPMISKLYGEQYYIERFFLMSFFLAAAFSAMGLMIGNVILANYGQWYWLGVHIINISVLSTVTFLYRDMGSYAGAYAYLVGTASVLVGACIVLARQLANRRDNNIIRV